jgi:hypothetical protein
MSYTAIQKAWQTCMWLSSKSMCIGMHCVHGVMAHMPQNANHSSAFYQPWYLCSGLHVLHSHQGITPEFIVVEL